MKIELSVEGVPCTIRMYSKTMDRLKHSCFRRSMVRCAGNFLFWRNAFHLFTSEAVEEAFLDRIQREIANNASQRRITISCADFVGWDSTDDLENYPDHLLERFEVNDRSTAWRIKPEHKHVRAPKTELITIAYEHRILPDYSDVIIHTIYPGKDIGQLRGDITEATQRVFFDWNHPGA